MEFTKKVGNLLSSTENSFIKEALKASNETLSGEGALKYQTSGNDFVDNFCSISRFKEPRSYEEIDRDMHRLWSQDPLKCLKLAVYIRMITRKPQVQLGKYKFETLPTQKGQGLKHEGIMRLIWIAINHPKVFKANIYLFIAAGSWKDIFTMLSLDLQYNGQNHKLEWTFLVAVIKAGLVNPNTQHLIRKYLPTIRTNKKCKTLEAQADTIVGRTIARMLRPYDDPTHAYKMYRQLKASGLAHDWQQKISKQLYNEIQFDKIAGRALNLLVKSKFLDNHDLRDKYTEWISAKPIAKYTGFVFELFAPLDKFSSNWRTYQYEYPKIDGNIKATINAQFTGLVQTAKEEGLNTRFLVARDISGSMTSKASGCNISAYSVAKAMALYFSELLTGPFANSYIAFSTDCKVEKWKGQTPVDKWLNDTNGNFGATNFLGIAKLFAAIKATGVLEADFPEGLLCISDGEFSGSSNVTNFKSFRSILKAAGFSEEYVKNFKLVLWDIPNSFYNREGPVFEDFADAPNCFHISGYDPVVITFLMGKGYNPCNSLELFKAAMNQELLNKLKI